MLQSLLQVSHGKHSVWMIWLSVTTDAVQIFV